MNEREETPIYKVLQVLVTQLRHVLAACDAVAGHDGKADRVRVPGQRVPGGKEREERPVEREAARYEASDQAGRMLRRHV